MDGGISCSIVSILCVLFFMWYIDRHRHRGELQNSESSFNHQLNRKIAQRTQVMQLTKENENDREQKTKLHFFFGGNGIR